MLERRRFAMTEFGEEKMDSASGGNHPGSIEPGMFDEASKVDGSKPDQRVPALPDPEGLVGARDQDES